MEHAQGNEELVVTTSAADGTVRLWDRRAARVQWCAARVAGVTHACMREHFVAACTDGGEVLWLDVRRAAESLVVDCASAVVWRVHGGRDEVNQVALSVDDGGAVVVACDDAGAVHAFQTLDGVARPTPGTVHDSGLAVSVACRAGSQAVSVGTDCALRLWSHGPDARLIKSCVVEVASSASSASASTLCNPPHMLHVSVHSNGRHTASALGDGRCLLYDCKERKVAAYVVHGTYSVSHASFPRPNRLLTAGNDARAVLWEFEPRKCKETRSCHEWRLAGKPNWTSVATSHILFALDDVVRAEVIA